MPLKRLLNINPGKTILSCLIVFFVITTVLISSPAFPESVFMKDGSIVEGTVTGESDSYVKLKGKDNKVREIPRRKVLRVTFDQAFKKTVYLKRSSGKTIEGHVVDENATEYTIRENLDSPAEYIVEKKDIIAISSEKYTSRGTYYAFGIIPGVAQLYAGRDGEGITFLSLAIASLGFAGYAYYDFNKKHDDYKSVPRGSVQTEFDSKYDLYKKSATVFVISLGVFASIYAANWIDVIFFAAPDFSPNKEAAAGSLFYNMSMGEVNYDIERYGCEKYMFNFSTGVRF